MESERPVNEKANPLSPDVKKALREFAQVYFSGESDPEVSKRERSSEVSRLKRQLGPCKKKLGEMGLSSDKEIFDAIDELIASGEVQISPEADEDFESEQERQIANDRLTADLRLERDLLQDRLIEVSQKIAGEYKSKFYSFLAYQNGFFDDLPEFKDLAVFRESLRERGVRDPIDLAKAIGNKKLAAYRRLVHDLFRYERQLLPEEAKLIRQKASVELSGNMRLKGMRMKVALE